MADEDATSRGNVHDPGEHVLKFANEQNPPIYLLYLNFKLYNQIHSSD